ncbi:PepSY-associated TM helix domain-containing protein [Wenyingzhuangia aestuarii]|uniref:PepSY-associated TM helix domain-containing protein n=1 Tax=Wenyingzhuangia aestuarii TaxID=1647582 RepID=UPI00143A50CC|nr:PepSY-associated TM helix domain-containing protein [Wenyingzhuangia aestuarii]NJB82671.1 putative iron-regulated membrane protein [Wenyingzhuangia aestuarii]
MNKRNYNILFHTHTVSGIVISVVLYIIFFAGSFSFFKDEIINWERNESATRSNDIHLDVDTALDSLDKTYSLFGRDISIEKHTMENRVNVSLKPSKDSLATSQAKSAHFFYLDTQNYTTHSYVDSYSLGEFLYRLHFLAQIKYPVGYYLSGFTAFFFLFAILTGLWIHWKKIISNFHVFRPWAKLKSMWTDAHTALGMIGLPFQFVYAVTGTFFMIKLLVVAPNIMVLYNGDKQQLFKDLEYTPTSYNFHHQPTKEILNIDACMLKVKQKWNGLEINKVYIHNYGDRNMHVSVEGILPYKEAFTGIAQMTFDANGTLISEKSPQKASYLESVKNILYRIHFGDYGGYFLKIISFLLGLLSCFVIISGVMIWLTARKKKNIPEQKRRFNAKVVLIYLAVCLSMYPITALSFIAVKVFAQHMSQSFIYAFYFIGWLIFTVYFIIKKDLYYINKWTLKLGSYIGLCIPITNGFVTGNWFWTSFKQQQFQLFFIDFFWICLSILTLWISFKIKRKDH